MLFDKNVKKPSQMCKNFFLKRNPLLTVVISWHGCPFSAIPLSNAGCAKMCGKLVAQSADQRAANQPRQCFDKKIARKMLVFFHRPCLHRLVPHHHHNLAFMKLKSRRAMRQPADVFECLSQQAARFSDKTAICRSGRRIHKSKHEAFGQLGAKVLVTRRFLEIAHEEPDCGLFRRLSRFCSLERSGPVRRPTRCGVHEPEPA